MSAQRVGDDLYWVLPNGTHYLAGGSDNSNCTISVCPVELSVYGYRPSLPFSSVLIALYGLCMLVQIVLGWRYRAWGFMAAMVLGCIDEMLGFGGRIMMYQNPWGQAGFIMQIGEFGAAPVGPCNWFANFGCSAHHHRARLLLSSHLRDALPNVRILLQCPPTMRSSLLTTTSVNYISPSASRFPPALYYYIFIPCDIVSLILQAVGGAMSSTSNGKSQTGVNIALAGLAFQVVTLFFFIVCTVDYMFRSRHVWRSQGVQLSGRFKNFCAWLSLATILILARCCYRVSFFHCCVWLRFLTSTSGLRTQ